MLRVDKRGGAAHLLRLGHAMQRNRGLTGGFRPVNLYNTAARQAADAQREIQSDRSGRDMVDIHTGVFTQAHNRAFAELLFDLPERGLQRLLFIGRRRDRFQLFLGSHEKPPARFKNSCSYYSSTKK